MRWVAIGTTLTLLAAAPALAVEPEAFLDRLRASYAFMGYELEFGQARSEGDAIVVDGVRAAVVHPEGLFGPVALDVELRFEGVAETEGGIYTAETLFVEHIAFEHNTGHETFAFTVDDVRIGGFYLPPGDVRAIDSLALTSDLETGPMRFNQDGMDVWSIEAVRATTSFNPPPGTGALVDLSWHLVVEGMTVRTGLEKGGAKTGMAIFGRPHLDGRLEATLTWEIARGRISLEPLRLAFNGQGELEFWLTMDGLTPDVMQMIYESERRAAEMMSKGKTQSAEELEMRTGLELLDKLHLVNGRIRYEDASLADRLLAHLAREKGQDVTAYTEGLLQQLSLALANARAPELANSVVGAMRQFLSDPGSIEVAMAPASPLRLITAASAAINPAGLANMLGLSVKAQAGGEITMPTPR